MMKVQTEVNDQPLKVGMKVKVRTVKGDTEGVVTGFNNGSVLIKFEDFRNRSYIYPLSCVIAASKVDSSLE